MRNLLLKGLLLLTGVFFSFCLLEVAVRFLNVEPRPLNPLPLAMYQLSDSPVIGFEYLPGYTPSANDPAGFSEHNRFPINQSGFRGHDYTLDKPDDTYRIMVLGDSTTVGIGVPESDNIFTQRLETLLNADSGDPRHFEVMNMGVGGYHAMQEAETLRVKGIAYNPDLVLVVFCVNDFALHADGRVYERLLRANPLAAHSVAMPLHHRLLMSSRLAFVVYHRFHGMELSMSDHDRWYVANVLHGRTPVRAGFELVEQLRERHGFEVRVVILPEFGAPFSQYRSAAIHRKVQEIAQDLPGIPVIDLLDDFAALGNNPRAFAWDGLHLDEHGHEVMARILLPLVQGVTQGLTHDFVSSPSDVKNP